MTNPEYIAMALPNGCRVEEDPYGRTALTMTGNSAEFFHRLLGQAVRQLAEKQWDEQRPSTGPQELHDGIQEWRPGFFEHSPDAVVWTKPGALVMVQNIKPGDLHPHEADLFGRMLIEAAHYASQPEVEQ